MNNSEAPDNPSKVTCSTFRSFLANLSKVTDAFPNVKMNIIEYGNLMIIEYFSKGEDGLIVIKDKDGKLSANIKPRFKVFLEAEEPVIKITP